MKFWDASALVPLFTQESTSTEMIRLEAADPVVQVWWGTRVEVKAALFRKALTGHLTRERVPIAVGHVDRRFDRLYIEVEPSSEVRSRAEALLSAHDLRAADALQLASFLENGGTPEFVCLDRRLRDAALAEGATVLP